MEASQYLQPLQPNLQHWVGVIFDVLGNWFKILFLVSLLYHALNVLGLQCANLTLSKQNIMEWETKTKSSKLKNLAGVIEIDENGDRRQFAKEFVFW
jgi:hypothetical protein